MVKKIYQYVLGYIVAVFIIGFVAVFVPPFWAICQCLYNVVKELIILPGSLIGSGVVLLFTFLLVRTGKSYWKSFGISLGSMVIVFIILGFSVSYIVDIIESSDWLKNLSIFQVPPFFPNPSL